MTADESVFDSSKTGPAFGLVCGAAAATAVGSLAVFFPRLAKLATAPVLSASLGFATGVMLYVSMVDIYMKSIEGFEESGHSEEKAFTWATLTFFAGIFLMKILNLVIYALLRMAGQEDLDLVRQGMDEMVARNAAEATIDPAQEQAIVPADIDGQAEKPGSSSNTEETDSIDAKLEEDKMRLVSMGSATACAVALHNFPEGLVTFVGYVSDPAVGVALAIGITLHNIPEGLCVAMPIYYGTGSKWKGFFWGSFSGFSEPLGAIVGWLVAGNSFSGTTYGILFGLVAGIMVYICLDELFPTAYRYNPSGEIVTWSCVFGMFLIALSLMLFSL